MWLLQWMEQGVLWHVLRIFLSIMEYFINPMWEIVGMMFQILEIWGINKLQEHNNVKGDKN